MLLHQHLPVDVALEVHEGKNEVLEGHDDGGDSSVRVDLNEIRHSAILVATRDRDASIIDRRQSRNDGENDMNGGKDQNTMHNEQLDTTGSLCVIMRTYVKQMSLLRMQLINWNTMAHAAERNINIFIVNTDPHASSDNFIPRAMTIVPESKLAPNLNMYHWTLPTELRSPNKSLYGYDATQKLLDEVRAARDKFQCQTFLFTNGDNFYHKDLLMRTGMDGSRSQFAQRREEQLVGFHFISHHRRNTLIPTEFYWGRVDLGAVFVDESALSMCPTAGFHDRDNKEQNFALDWFFFRDLLDSGATWVVLPLILLAHQ